MKQINKMKFSDEQYKLIIEETQQILRDINQDHLINFNQINYEK